MYKSNTELIVIDAKATEPIPTNVVFWSHDKGTAKLAFELKKDPIPQSLAKGTIVPICLDFVGGRHIYHAVIEDAINGIVSIVLEDNILGYVGRVTGSIYIELPDSRSLDTAGRFTFDIKRSPIDEDVPELENYYWQGFNEIMNQYHQTITEIETESERLLNELQARILTLEEKLDDVELNSTLVKALANVNQYDSKIATIYSNVLADHVEIETARGYANTLGERLDHMELTDASTSQDISVVSGQIDNLIALPDGSTTNDARLEDITVGADGITYDSPGNAVRGQYSKVNSKIERFKDNFRYIGLTETDAVFTVTENTYAGSTGYIASTTHDSYEVSLQNETTLYFESYDDQYTSLCVYTSGVVGGDGYTRYRALAGGENTLPNIDTKKTLPSGTVIIISVSKNNGNFKLMQNGEVSGFYLSNDVKLNAEQIKQFQVNSNTYLLNYTDNELKVNGNGVECVFNTTTFTGQDGLFELQNLTYNNDVIFGTNNDYIGPLRVNGEPIKGAKHDGEVTDSVLITTDKGVLQNGQTVEASKFTVFVRSHISDEFDRISSYSFNGNTMTTHSIITTLKDLQIDYVFGAGIISCQDDVNVAWLNKEKLTTDVMIGLNEQTSIICQNGTLISKRLTVNSDYGDQRVSFTTYDIRKKLYYYTVYGNNIAVPSGTVFASSTELAFS